MTAPVSDDTNLYEHDRLMADRRLVATIGAVMLVPALFFIVNDVLLARGDRAMLVQMAVIRLVFIAAIGYGAWRIGHVTTRRELDRRLVFTLALTVCAVIALRLVRPRDSLHPTYFEVLVVIGTYAGIPLPPRKQVLVALPMTLAVLAIDFFWAQGVSPATQIALVGTFGIANLMGWLVALNRQALITREADLWARERAARIDLERTLGELRTLRGIIPVCAGCSKVRTDNGDWQRLEAYIRAHTDAEFSHGLCPACITRLYPELGAVGKARN